MRSMNIVVLGGSGFVGSHLCARLVTDGHNVKVITRRPERAVALRVLPGLSLIRGDVHHLPTLISATEGADVLINLVGILNEKGRSGKGFEHAHFELAHKTLIACQTSGVGRLLHMSGLPAAQDGPSHYLRSKGRAEAEIRHSPNTVAWTIFRPSVIFGPGDSFLNRFAGLLRLLPVMPLARINAKLSPVYVEDVVSAFIKALHDPSTAYQSYDLGGPNVMTLGDTVRYVQHQLKLHRIIFGLPDSLGFLQAALMEFLPGKPLSVDNYRSLAAPSVCASDGLAALGIKATALDEVVPLYFGKSRLSASLDQLRTQRRA